MIKAKKKKKKTKIEIAQVGVFLSEPPLLLLLISPITEKGLERRQLAADEPVAAVDKLLRWGMNCWG